MRTRSRKEYPLEMLLELIGGKWKVSILWWLRLETKRFTELHRAIPGITQKMLTHQLRELEHHGIIRRKVYPVVPPKVEYSMTEFGGRLKVVLDDLGSWAEANTAEIKKAYQKAERQKKKLLP